jgi:hypothetical protein
MSLNDRQLTLTASWRSTETGEITAGASVQRNGNEIMAAIQELGTRLAASSPQGCQTGGRSGAAGPAPAGAAQQGAGTAAAPASDVVLYRKAATKVEQESLAKVSMDVRTTLTYSKALDALDRKDRVKAVELLNQVIEKEPNFQPARDALARARSGN